MPTRRLRKHLFDRFSRDLRSAGELGLAFLMTAGVASCGGETAASKDAGTKPPTDAAKDTHTSSGFDGMVIVEAARVDATFFEAAQVDATFFEAAQVDATFIEAAQVEGGVIDGLSTDSGPVMEGAQQVEGGTGH